MISHQVHLVLGSSLLGDSLLLLQY
jgi:hypothetical protein